jgi:hypothetical protein
VRKQLNGNMTAQLFSATAKTGVDEARDVLRRMLVGAQHAAPLQKIN